MLPSNQLRQAHAEHKWWKLSTFVKREEKLQGMTTQLLLSISMKAGFGYLGTYCRRILGQRVCSPLTRFAGVEG